MLNHLYHLCITVNKTLENEMNVVEQIIRKGVFGLHELRELSEHCPYLLKNLRLCYGVDNKRLHNYVASGYYTYDDFSIFLEMFFNGEITENSQSLRFACNVFGKELKKCLGLNGE